MKFLHPAAVASLLCLTATSMSAQSFEHCGLLDETDFTGFLREQDDQGVPKSVGYNAIYSTDDFVGWGFDSGAPGMIRLDGVRVLLGDLDSSSTEIVDIFVYPESPVTPGSPDLSNPAVQLSFPVFGAGNPGQPLAARFDLMFPMPASIPVGDVFLEVFCSAVRAPGLVVGVLSGEVSLSNPTFDIANNRTSDTGHGLGAVGGYTFALFTDLTPPRAEGFQTHITPLVSGQAGLALGVSTQQGTLPGSLAPGMSASFFSALQPSALADRNGNSRMDDIGFFINGPFGPTDPITIFMTPLGFSAGPINLSDFFVGSVGSLCLNLDGPLVELATIMDADDDGFATFRLTLPAASRMGIQGIDFAFQAIGIDLANVVLNATGCANQQW